MKILLDACVWGGVKDQLLAEGYDVIWAGEWPEDPGDDEILAIAHEQGRVLITLDKDFGELAIIKGMPHSGIVRLVNLSARQQGAYCQRILKAYLDDLRPGAILTVDQNRVRVRPGS